MLAGTETENRLVGQEHRDHHERSLTERHWKAPSTERNTRQCEEEIPVPAILTNLNLSTTLSRRCRSDREGWMHLISRDARCHESYETKEEQAARLSPFRCAVLSIE